MPWAIMRKLGQAGARTQLLDLSHFPQSLRLSMRYDAPARHEFTIATPDDTPVDLADVKAVWWRRPQPFGLDPAILKASHRGFAYNESLEAFAGLWQALNVSAPPAPSTQSSGCWGPMTRSSSTVLTTPESKVSPATSAEPKPEG